MRVETMRGAMAVDGLGTTLMHEYVFVLTPDVIRHGIGGTEVRAAFVKGVVEERGLTAESYKTALRPRWNYTPITDDVLPALRNTASTRPRSRRCWSRNPARYFTGGPE